MKKLMSIFAIVLIAFAICGGGVFLATNTPISAESAVTSQDEEISAQTSGYWIDYGDSLSGYSFSRTGNVVNIYSINDMAAALAGVNHNWYFTSDNVYLKNVNFVLKTDLDLSARWWTPMKLSANAYFDGNGHRISGAYVDVVNQTDRQGDTSSVAYIGFLERGTIKNVILSGWVRVKTTGWSSDWSIDTAPSVYVGGAVASGTAYNVINDDMDIFVYAPGHYRDIDTAIGPDICVGGIVGTGEAYDCAMNSSSGRDMGYSEYAEESYSIYVVGGYAADTVYVGGIVGTTKGVKRCVSDAKIYCGGFDKAWLPRIGGLVGSGGGTISDSVVSDRAYVRVYGFYLTSTYTTGGIGGVVGEMYGSSGLSNLYSYAKVEAYCEGIPVGGILGHGESGNSLNNCAYFGSARGESEVGGIVGKTDYNNRITDCGFYGSANSAGYDAGGLVGKNEEKSVSISKCVVYGYAYASLKSKGYSYVGINSGVINRSNCNDFRYYEYTLCNSGDGTANATNNSRWNGVWNSASSMVNQLAEDMSYSITSLYDVNKDWIVIANGTCGFGNYKNTYCNQVYPYIMLPMKVFRPVTTYAFYRKPPESPSDKNRDYGDGWNQVVEANSFVSKSSTVGLFVNGVNRAVSFTMTNDYSSTFDVSGIWGGFMDTNTDPHLGTGVTQKIVFEGRNTYTLASWSFSSTKSSQTRSFTTDLFWSGDSSTPLMIHFYLECKETNFTIQNDSTKGTVVVTPKGTNRKNFTYAYRNGKWGYGPFYYNDTISSIKVTPKVGYYVKKVKWNYSSYTTSSSYFKVYDNEALTISSPDKYGIVKVDKGWQIPTGLKADIVVEYAQVEYKVQAVPVWEGNNTYEATLAPSTIIAMPNDTALGYKYRLYFSQNAVTYPDGVDEESEKNFHFVDNGVAVKYGYDDIVALDGGGNNYRGIDLTGNGGTISTSLDLSYSECVSLGKPSIFTNVFYVYVTREVVEFGVSVENMANSVDNLKTISSYENKFITDYYDTSASHNHQTPIGGVVGIKEGEDASSLKTSYFVGGENKKKFIASDLKLDGKVNISGLQLVSFYGWNSKGLSFTKVESTNSDATALGSAVATYDVTKDFWSQFMLWKYPALASSGTQEGVMYDASLDNDDDESSNLQFIFYSYHLLGTYSFATSIEVDGATGVLGSGNFDAETDEGKTSAENETTTLSFGTGTPVNVHYFANVSISEKGLVGKNDYIFEGYYLRKVGQADRLLTREKEFDFSNNNSLICSMLDYYGDDFDFVGFGYSLDGLGSRKKVSSLTIVAKYGSVTKLTPTALTAQRNVYTIRTRDDLIQLSQMVNSGTDFENCTINQVADIDLNGVMFNPIGDLNNPFKGTYNGNNHLIKNLKTAGGNGADIAYRGLFGHTAGATIKNLTIYSGLIYGSFAGSVVGHAVGTTFERVNNYGCIINNQSINHYTIYNEAIATPSGEQRKIYGGLVGSAENCAFFACSNRAQVGFDGSTEVEVSGLVGKTFASVSLDQCFNEGALFGAGALDLTNGSAVFKNCYNRCLINKSSSENFYNSSGESIATPSVDGIWVCVNGKIVLKTFYWH